MRKIIFSCFFILLTTAGCSQLFSSPTPADKSAVTGSTVSGSIEAKTTKASPPAKGTQITWESPSEPVDGFVIRYGANPKKLEREVKVSAKELRQEQDPEFGSVYRYVIKNGSEAPPLYVSVAAFKGDRLSDFSTVIEER